MSSPNQDHSMRWVPEWASELSARVSEMMVITKRMVNDNMR